MRVWVGKDEYWPWYVVQKQRPGYVQHEGHEVPDDIVEAYLAAELALEVARDALVDALEKAGYP